MNSKRPLTKMTLIQVNATKVTAEIIFIVVTLILITLGEHAEKMQAAVPAEQRHV
jgi:hypothetical protein